MIEVQNMNLIGRIIERVRRMVDRNTIKRITGEDPELTKLMVRKIEEWRAELEGHAFWIKSNVPSLRIETGICREFSDVVLNEMSVDITNEKLQELYEANTKELNEALQEGLGLGSFIIKPLGEGMSEVVPADMFVPISFGLDKKPDDIVFFDIREMGDGKKLIRIERHSIKNGFLEIENIAYRSSDRSGFEGYIPLESVDEWAKLPEYVAYPGMAHMDFGYYRNPIKNTIDDTSCGVSIFNAAIEMIRKADIQGARLDWEFESGERAIHASTEAIKRGKNGQFGMAKLNDRLYRGIDVEDSNLLKEYSPTMREASFISGLQEYYRQIEFIVGLGYGDLSNADSVDKTATEVRASKQRKYNRVTAIQDNLRGCLEDFVSGIAFYASLYTSGYEMTVTFSDSILTDEQADRQLMLQEIAAGIRQPWEYRMKYMSEDEETAKSMVAIVEDVIE